MDRLRQCLSARPAERLHPPLPQRDFCSACGSDLKRPRPPASDLKRSRSFKNVSRVEHGQRPCRGGALFLKPAALSRCLEEELVTAFSGVEKPLTTCEELRVLLLKLSNLSPFQPRVGF